MTPLRPIEYNMHRVMYEREMMQREQIAYFYACAQVSPVNIPRKPIELPKRNTVTYIYGRGGYGMARSDNGKSFEQNS